MNTKYFFLIIILIIILFVTIWYLSRNTKNNITNINSATWFTKQSIIESIEDLDFDNDLDYIFASKGFIGTLAPGENIIYDTDREIVFDINQFSFLKYSPQTANVNPSLWRRAQLLEMNGLFKVCHRVYQVRGFDLANITFIQGDRGFIVVDTLSSAETAAAAYKLIKKYLGDIPILNVIHTHSHIDHFGGVKGIVSEADVNSGTVQIIAPKGFFEDSIQENVLFWNVMSRRSGYMYGNLIPKNECGQVSTGLGLAESTGTYTIIKPTILITEPIQELIIDGIKFVFQLTPDTEAPTEMNFYLPELKALCTAENISSTLHNILTPRGALVRDCKAWANYLTKTINLYGHKSDVLFMVHSWPIFGQDNILYIMEKTRDMYKYMNDQTVKMMNQGLGPAEIAEQFKFPKSIGLEWFNREYYGSIKFNVKAIYQRYLGWFDGNPVSLNKLPLSKSSSKYVQAMGGENNVITQAKTAIDSGDYRWAIELLDHVVRTNPGSISAKNMLAFGLEQLAYQSENAVWRNFDLTGAQELRADVLQKSISIVPDDIVYQLTPEMIFDYLSTKLDSNRADDKIINLVIKFIDVNEKYFVSIKNNVLVNYLINENKNAEFTLFISKTDFINLLFYASDVNHSFDELVSNHKINYQGDSSIFLEFVSLFDKGDRWFPLVANTN